LHCTILPLHYSTLRYTTFSKKRGVEEGGESKEGKQEEEGIDRGRGGGGRGMKGREGKGEFRGRNDERTLF
jgi:hypothetical protein